MEFTSTRNFAGRQPVYSDHNVTASKNGQYHTQILPSGSSIEVLCCGLACSEIFSGPLLGKCLKSGVDYEMESLDALMNGNAAKTLSVHTSAGIPPAMRDFLAALKNHLPWSDLGEDEWFVR